MSFFKANLAGFGLAALLASGPAQPATFPDKPVTIVVPYSPGGGSDNVSRATAKHLSELWRQPVIVENLPGADGLIGTRRVMKAAPDGYTLLVSIPAIAIFKHTNKDLDVDPLSQLTPVSMLASGPTAMVVKGKSEIQAIDDLRKACAPASAKCTWASGEPFTLMAGSGLVSSLDLFDRMANVRYNGTSAAVSDVIGGHITLLVTGISSVVPHHRSGALKILAVSTSERIPDLPDVPTYAETGMGAVEFTNNWYGIFAPAGTPEDVKQAISKGIQSAAQDPAVKKVLGPLLITPVGTTPEEFERTLKRDQQTVDRLAAKLPAPK
jgi:tripartite-type tricarboxylate transporter receptor subunit TctC